MNFLDGHKPTYDLTYSDVFLVPSKSDVGSRMNTDITPIDDSGLTFPVVVSNMTAVAGRRMAETVARRGGVTILPQDVPFGVAKEAVEYIKSRHHQFETPVTLNSNDTVQKALNLIYKRAHEAIVVVDDQKKPIGIFTPQDAERQDRFTKIEFAMSKEIVSLKSSMSPEEMHRQLDDQRLSFAPVVDGKGVLVGAMTKQGCVRNAMYTPALGKDKGLLIAMAVGINGDAPERAKKLVGIGVDIIVVDTAHGHQQKMIDVVAKVRKAVGKDTTIVAGNVVTAAGTSDLINAGANIVKVGVGPGAMCTTRMMTGVGRPQLSAVIECVAAAKKAGGHVWADGGIRHPRDVALALAAGASAAMFGSWWAGTYESAADTLVDSDGSLYKENYGMASARAVSNRTRHEDAFSKAQKAYFQEGISTSKVYLRPGSSSAEEIVDQIGAGVRSSMTYAGAKDLSEFSKKAVVGLQSGTGFFEGKPVSTNW